MPPSWYSMGSYGRIDRVFDAEHVAQNGLCRLRRRNVYEIEGHAMCALGTIIVFLRR
jgi:hypothetical protein